MVCVGHQHGTVSKQSTKVLKMRAPHVEVLTVGARIIRIGFWSILYYKYNEEPPT